jgi:hypothetical protein
LCVDSFQEAAIFVRQSLRFAVPVEAHKKTVSRRDPAMHKRIFVFLALALALFVAPSKAQSLCGGGGDQPPCPSITNTFSPGTTTGTYDFRSTGDGLLVVQFDTVLTTFSLTVTINHNIDPFDLSEFPAGTVAVTYCNRNQDQYDFTGSAGGPNGVPVKNTDYKGLITLTLTYNVCQPVHVPAFGHAPGDSTTFTEDILTAYSEPFSDPTMSGTTPGLSSVVAADEPFVNAASLCGLTLTPTNNASGQKSQIEVTFKMVSTGGNCSTGTGLRDKTARLSVSTTDTNGNTIFPALKNVEANKFHWDNKNGLNEYDISLDGLASGQYTVTVFSSSFSPQSATFTVPLP